MSLQFPKEYLMQKEYDAWQEVVALLRKAGAVTETDCDAPASRRDTPGQKLFGAVRAWGDALATLRSAEPSKGTPS